MKTFAKTLLAVLIVLAVVMGLLQWLLQSHLTPMMHRALPQVSEATGLDIRMDAAFVNLFAGQAGITGLAAYVPNTAGMPPTVSLDRAFADLDWLSLLRRTIRITDLAIDNARITIIRQADGKMLLPGGERPIPRTLPDRSPEPSEEQPPMPDEQPDIPPPSVPSTLPRILIRKAGFTAGMTYEDRTKNEDVPSRIGVDIEVAAKDIATFGNPPPGEWGQIRLTSSSPTHPGAFQAEVELRVAPILAPATITMTAKGRMANVNLRELGNLTDTLGITGDSADITLDLDVRGNRFHRGSVIQASIRHAALTGELREKNPRVSLPEQITLVIPVGGTLTAPEFSLTQAVTQSLLRNLADNPDFVLDQITIDGKSLRERLGRRPRRE